MSARPPPASGLVCIESLNVRRDCENGVTKLHASKDVASTLLTPPTIYTDAAQIFNADAHTARVLA